MPRVKRRGVDRARLLSGLTLVAGSMLALTTGCTPVEAATPQLLEVRAAAAASSEVDGNVGEVECWDLEAHIIDAAADPTVFRVLCRVHYDQAGTARWRDMTCIGDLDRRPVLEYCYPWLPYDGVPTFEDGA